MRPINEIIIHCSATPEGRDVSVADIRQWHLQRGFNDIGYHYVVYRDGSVHIGRPLRQVGAHCLGHNAHSIGICYIGGCEAVSHRGQLPSKDTRTPEQKVALRKLITELRTRFPKARVLGHRDTSPDKNGNGKIERWEWLKDCPCFDAVKEYSDV